MRKPTMDLETVKLEIMNLKGKNIQMEVNKGRKKIAHYEGILEDIYKSVFVVRLFDNNGQDKLSYSFSDVLCGDVKIEIKNKI